MNKTKILYLAKSALKENFEQGFAQHEFETHYATCVDSAMGRLKNSFPDIIIADLSCGSKESHGLLQAFNESNIFAHVPVVVAGDKLDKLQPELREKVYIKSAPVDYTEMASFVRLMK
ncbi:MAG: hypothetical protein KC478_07305 [Bacteriovoracaceae bacterium]|nr:hypothetical protein [Bacteriovoracaceae bacterium]